MELEWGTGKKEDTKMGRNDMTKKIDLGIRPEKPLMPHVNSCFPGSLSRQVKGLICFFVFLIFIFIFDYQIICEVFGKWKCEIHVVLRVIGF